MDLLHTPIDLDCLQSIAVAVIDASGQLIEANTGFCRLINADPQAYKSIKVDHLFIQPDFSNLINSPADNEDKIFQGLLTLGQYSGLVRSLETSIWRENDQFTLLAEYDVNQLEKLNDTVLKLNQDYARSQFEMTQINLKLRQREQQLEQSLDELKKTQKQLLEAEKMAALGMLVAGVAHEINTPLGVSMGSISVLNKKMQSLKQCYAAGENLETELESFFNKSEPASKLICSNLERIARLTDTLSKTAVDNRCLPKTTFNLKNCLDNALSSYQNSLTSKGIKVNVLCHPDLKINSWFVDWSSIFSNLIGNSIQHGFKGREKGLIKIIIKSEAKHLKVEYSDDGVGLSEQIKKKIFDPFYTTDMQQGMGLGMHIVYNIIKHKMQGSICCENSSSTGANFQIDIPL